MLTPGEDADGVRVLTATGELDAHTAPALAAHVPGLVAGARAVVLDLTALEFLDSAGVRLLDRLARACRDAACALQVVAPPGGRARRVLDLVGLGPPLVGDDLPAALARVRAG